MADALGLRRKRRWRMIGALWSKYEDHDRLEDSAWKVQDDGGRILAGWWGGAAGVYDFGAMAHTGVDDGVAFDGGGFEVGGAACGRVGGFVGV